MSSSSPPHIGLLVTGNEAVQDFIVFNVTLRTWHPDAVLYVYTDSATEPILQTIRTKVGADKLHIRVALDAYLNHDRAMMEALPGKTYNTLFTDFTFEKTHVLDWMFDATGGSAPMWLMDADILHLAPLPSVPESAALALSPHYIRAADEARFGHYNAGFLCMRDRSLLDVWRKAGHTSTFYEQKALETVATSASELYEFPPQVNFGWWRLFQSPEAPPIILQRFSIYRPDKSIGIRYNGAALQSIHTHMHRLDESHNHMFNVWFIGFLEKFKVHKPIARLFEFLSPIFKPRK
jgi:hypothetical protein